MTSIAATELVAPPARELWDIVIVGGGPAGLAVAIVAAEQGLSVLVLERRDFPPDKACGEGLLPPGVRALERLGVAQLLDRSSSRSFGGIRFIQENGRSAEAVFRDGSALGIRRTVLVEEMTRRAESLGAVVRHQCAVNGSEVSRDHAIVRSSSGNVSARLVVAADGLHSPLRRAAGLERPQRRRRFGLRQHFEVRPWTDFVEVYADTIGEAYVTPVSDEIININFVWEDGEIDKPSIATLAKRFPILQSRIGNAAPISSVMGAGPMAQRAKRRACDRMVLIGDAAGFVDSISADGLSIAFNSALILGPLLPGILAQGATQQSLRAYESQARRLYRRYWIVTYGLLMFARHPRARTIAINYFSRHPAALRVTMGGAMRLMTSAV